MNKLLIIIGITFFIGCKESTAKEEINAEKKNSEITAKYDDWQTAKGEKIEFKYPENWRLKINKTKGTTQFGLTNDPDTSSRFYPIEIWEFNSSGGSFEDFSAAPNLYFEKATDGKRANLMNLSKVKFKNFEAKKYEFIKYDSPVEITTVNGISRYYLLISYKEDSVHNYANDIFNSINILNQ